ncbi:MAG: ABC transporter permease [Ignavibacteriales bacterium]|nr:ABC transporter permease [Ignavibacteriales bacterium]
MSLIPEFFRLLRVEMVKTFLKKRTYLGFLIILLIVPLVEIALKIEGGRFLRMAMRGIAQDFILLGNVFNGWFVSLQIMNSLWIQIPILISFVAGDQLAGEATGGTYRLLLIRPVSRTKIFLAKYLTTVLYVVLFVTFLGVLSVGLALLLLGSGDMIVLQQGILVLPESDVAWRFVMAYILAAWSMTTVASIGFLFSSFVENAIGPIVGTMGVIIVLTIITVIPVETFSGIREYLFTYHMASWQKMFADPVPWGDIRSSVLNLAGYIIATLTAAWIIFVRKDVLS